MEEEARFFDAHLQDIRDALAPKRHLQGFFIVASAPAGFTRDIDVCQKVHIDPDQAISLAGFAPASGHVETEASRVVAALPTQRKIAEQIPDRPKRTRVGGRVGPRPAPNRGLIDHDRLIDLLQATNPAVGTGSVLGMEEVTEQDPAKDVIDQGRFATP